MEHHAASPVKNSELVEALGDWAGAPHHARLRAASAAANGGPGGAGLLAGILPEHLIATKQFRPFEDAAAASRGDSTPTTHTLLSAAEKIRELSKLLETARTERERLSREVEDVQVRAGVSHGACGYKKIPPSILPRTLGRESVYGVPPSREAREARAVGDRVAPRSISA